MVRLCSPCSARFSFFSFFFFLFSFFFFFFLFSFLFFFPPLIIFFVVLISLLGCQEISFVTNGFADPAGLFNAGFYFYCGQSSEFATGGNRAAAISVKYFFSFCFFFFKNQSYSLFLTKKKKKNRKKFFLNELYLSACFDELTYLHCSVFSFVAIPGSKASFLWTTETKPIRYKVSDVPPGQLSSDLGLSIAGGLHPGIYLFTFFWG